jgi:hypothetical protein
MGLRKRGPLPLIWGLKNLKTWANFDPMICQFYPTIIFNFRCFTVKISLVFMKVANLGYPVGKGPQIMFLMNALHTLLNLKSRENKLSNQLFPIRMQLCLHFCLFLSNSCMKSLSSSIAYGKLWFQGKNRVSAITPSTLG